MGAPDSQRPHSRLAAALNLAAFQFPHFIMQRGMLIGIKKRAEA